MWKSNGKTTALILVMNSFFFKNREECETDPLRKQESRVNYNPIRIYGVGLGVGMFPEEVSHGRTYSKKNGRQVERGQTDKRAGSGTDRHTYKTDV
jgi:hypothetical protein